MKLERFPAGTRADQQRFNQWTSDVVTIVNDLEKQVNQDLAELIRITDLTANQALSPKIIDATKLLEFAGITTGAAQHDSRYGQVIQPVTSWVVREANSYLVSAPRAANDPFIWTDITDQRQPYGLPNELAATKVVNFRVMLTTNRICNALVWEPFPAWGSTLDKVTLITSAGSKELLPSPITKHGPQRFFFNDTEVLGATVQLKTTVGGYGFWKFDLVRATFQPSAQCTIKAKNATINTVTYHGTGTITAVLKSQTTDPGMVDVTLRTPPGAPTSVLTGLTTT